MVRVPFNAPAASGQCDPCRTPPAQSRLNLPSLLYVLVVESDVTAAPSRRRPAGGPNHRRIPMFARLDAAPPQNADVIMRAVGAVALAALAMIHVIDLPGTLGPTPLIGAGYFGIVGVMITRPHWLAGAAAAALAASAMGGYVLTRALPGGFLGDHGDVGNWRCPLGIAALSVETLLILLVVLAAWQARARAANLPPRPQPAARRVPEYSQPR